MPLSTPTKLGPYEVLGPLGSGGMGEVYKARDTRLNRTVAIKISNAEFFDRAEIEARAVAALNHPHICQLYDMGALDFGGVYLVMEYLEGETLEARLAKGPIQPQQAVAIAIQIVDGLQAAHARGIVHRDLKPANIMLTKSGVKLLDFGLARMDRRVATDSNMATAAITNPGTILGTFQYMAPEQLEGKDADARTDLFAFGVVLYEMLAGRKAFQADNPAGLISAIMSAEPPAVSKLQPSTPPGLEHVVETSLAKDPDARWQSAHDVRLALTWLQSDARPPGAATPRSRERIAWGVALLLFIAAAALAVQYFRGKSVPVEVIRSSLLPPANWSFERSGFSVSPDGKRLAFVAFGPDGIDRLWVRAFSSSSAQQLNGTEGAMLPFWAPDSRRIGFFTLAGKLSTVDLGTAAVRILCEAPMGRCGATWNRAGTIVFSPSIVGPLLRVQDTGGEPVPVTTVVRQGSGQGHRWPLFLPDGKHFLYSVDLSTAEDTQGNGLYAGSIDGSAPKLVSSEIAGNVAYAAGYLLYAHERSLRARPFDPERLRLSGVEAPIAEQELEVDPGFSQAQFSASQGGVLVFRSLADSTSRLAWFDRTGKELNVIPEFGYVDPRLSPDGRFLAVSSDDTHTGKFFIRVYDLARGIATRLTDGGTDESPSWSPDGKTIRYATFDGKLHYVKEVSSNGSGSPQLILKGGGMMRHLDWSSSGQLLFANFSKGLPFVQVYSGAGHLTAPLGVGAEGRFSPDGKWIAYAGLGGINVQPFPGPGGRMNISPGTGTQPVWSRGGKTVFYIAPDRKLMAVDFDPRHKRFATPRVMFQTRIIAPAFTGTQYDASVDGRFLINSVPSNHSSSLTLLTNWTAQFGASSAE